MSRGSLNTLHVSTVKLPFINLAYKKGILRDCELLNICVCTTQLPTERSGAGSGGGVSF